MSTGRRDRRTRPKIVRLKQGVVPDDSRLIATLVFLLDEARRGKIRGYACVFIAGDSANGQLVEGADVLDESDAHALLGAMRRMEQAFLRRQFPDDL